MPHDRLDATIAGEVSALRQSGTAKGSETVIVGVEPGRGGLGPRYLLEGSGQRFIRMNSNSYLGLSRHPAVIEAEVAELARRSRHLERILHPSREPDSELRAALRRLKADASAAVSNNSSKFRTPNFEVRAPTA